MTNFRLRTKEELCWERCHMILTCLFNTCPPTRAPHHLVGEQLSSVEKFYPMFIYLLIWFFKVDARRSLSKLKEHKNERYYSMNMIERIKKLWTLTKWCNAFLSLMLFNFLCLAMVYCLLIDINDVLFEFHLINWIWYVTLRCMLSKKGRRYKLINLGLHEMIGRK